MQFLHVPGLVRILELSICKPIKLEGKTVTGTRRKVARYGK
jgi:hypothetical protein